MSKQTVLYKTLSVILLLGLLVAAYYYLFRPGQLVWGATAAELAGPMAGDDLVDNPDFYATRAVTIAGTPEEIWPWIVQMGYGRAGFYAYDLMENFGSPRGLHSAADILPEMQHLKVGDRIGISAIAYQVVDEITPNQTLVWADDADPHTSAFTWTLYPVDETHTRLVSRIRLSYNWTPANTPIFLFTDFADHVAVRKVLLGIKDRVEGRVEPLAVQNAAIGTWMIATLELLCAILLIYIWPNGLRAWLLGLAAAVVLLVSLYIHPPLWLSFLFEFAILLGLWVHFSPKTPLASLLERVRKLALLTST